MEQILSNIKNPFDIKGFTLLINMLINSSTGREFYGKVVTYYQDRTMEGTETYAEIPDDFITSKGMNHWQIIEYFSDFFTTEHRIYINSSLEATKKIIELFINECVNENIPFEIKYAVEANSRSDGIVIGSNTMAYKKHIDILRKIAKENPEIVSQCGTPHLLTARLDGWMGLADENVSNRFLSYSESRIGMILSACTKYLVRHPEFKNRVEGYETMCESYEWCYRKAEDAADIMIKRGRIAASDKTKFIEKYFNEYLANILNESEFKINYADLCKIINENPNEAIGEIYQLFLENCEKLGINPNMPTQYDTSKSDLLQVEEKETTGKKINLENKNYVNLINEYLSNSDGELTMQDSITVLRALDERMLSDVQLIANSLMDGFLLSNSTKDTEYLENSVYSVLKHCDIGDNELGGKLLKMCNIYMSSDKNNRKGKCIYSEILSSRIGLERSKIETIKEKNHIFFAKPLETRENMQKSLDILQSMLEKHNRKSPQLRNRNLEIKIEFLEFMVEHYNEIAEYFLAISTKLETLSNDEIENLVQKFHKDKRPTNIDFENKVGNARIAQGLSWRSERYDKLEHEDPDVVGVEYGEDEEI